MRRVSVYWCRGAEKIPIGTIATKPRSPTYFEWDKEFLNNDIELSPLRFRKQSDLQECPENLFGGLPGLLADAVPDGWGRTLLRRGLEKQGVKSTQLSPLDMLCYVGDRARGALSFEPRLHVEESWAEGEVDLRKLEKGIAPILEGTASEVIEQFLQGGVSPSGMRPKIVLKEKGGKFTVGGERKTGIEWLVKFPSPEDSRNSGKLEYVYSQMAKESGLEMSETRLIKAGKREYFATRLFDRTENGERVHVHTLSGLLNAPTSVPYVEYESLFMAARILTRDVREVEKAFKLATFNVLASNQDDHTRNVAFMMDNAGKWKLAPAYDLTFVVKQYHEHAMLLNGKGLPDKSDLYEVGRKFGIAPDRIKETFQRTEHAIAQFNKLAKRVELPQREIKAVEQVIGQRRGVRRSMRR